MSCATVSPGWRWASWSRSTSNRSSGTSGRGARRGPRSRCSGEVVDDLGHAAVRAGGAPRSRARARAGRGAACAPPPRRTSSSWPSTSHLTRSTGAWSSPRTASSVRRGTGTRRSPAAGGAGASRCASAVERLAVLDGDDELGLALVVGQRGHVDVDGGRLRRDRVQRRGVHRERLEGLDVAGRPHELAQAGGEQAPVRADVEDLLAGADEVVDDADVGVALAALPPPGELGGRDGAAGAQGALRRRGGGRAGGRGRRQGEIRASRVRAPGGGGVKPGVLRSRAVRSQPLGPRPAGDPPDDRRLAQRERRGEREAAPRRRRGAHPEHPAGHERGLGRGAREREPPRAAQPRRASRARRPRRRSGPAATAAGRRARGPRAPGRDRARARRRRAAAGSSGARASSLPASQRDCWLAAPSSDSGIAECTGGLRRERRRARRRARARGGARRPRSARTSSTDGAAGAPR